MTSSVALRLVEPLQGRGHHLYMDNFYTSPLLFRKIHEQGFEACGTLRLNRKGVTPEVKTPIKKGESRTVDVDEKLNIVQWHDKQVVSILSTLHGGNTVEVERRSRQAVGGREVENTSIWGELTGETNFSPTMGFPTVQSRGGREYSSSFLMLLLGIVISCIPPNNLDENSLMSFFASSLQRSSYKRQLPCHLPPTLHLTVLNTNPSNHLLVSANVTFLDSTRSQTVADRYSCSNKKGRGKKTTTFYCKPPDIRNTQPNDLLAFYLLVSSSKFTVHTFSRGSKKVGVFLYVCCPCLPQPHSRYILQCLHPFHVCEGVEIVALSVLDAHSRTGSVVPRARAWRLHPTREFQRMRSKG